MGQLTGKHILVTGASSGMGRVFCQMIANEGARVSLLARNEERLKDTLSKMSGEGHKYYLCDLTNEEEIKSAIEQLEALDGVVFCAGINDFVPLKFVKEEKLQRIYDKYPEIIFKRIIEFHF